MVEGGGGRPGLAPEVLAELVEAAPAALIVTDARGVVHLCNRAARELGGVPAGAALGRPLAQVFAGLKEAAECGGSATLGRARVEVAVTERGAWRVLAVRALAGTASARSVSLRMRAARVLVAEDNLVTQRVTAAILGQLGLRCEVASEGRAALAKIAETPFELVLMDAHMPGLDGLAATRALRAAPEPRRSLPVVAMTSSRAIEDRQDCFAAGVDACVTKPVAPAELGEVLARWLAAPEVEPLDEAALAELEGELGADEVGVLVEKLLGQVQKALVELPAADERGDLAGAGATAHALVGAAGALGARGVEGAARELERVCRWPAPRYVREAILGLEEAARSGEAALRAWLGWTPGTG